eukprot:gene9229-biopygen3974
MGCILERLVDNSLGYQHAGICTDAQMRIACAINVHILTRSYATTHDPARSHAVHTIPRDPMRIHAIHSIP